MATIDKLYKSMGLPMNIKRGNPWPLDASSLWYSYDEMKAYAEDASGVAYVGQILALVDEKTDNATAYIITDTNGSLKPIGAGSLGDNKTIIIEESGAIGLKDFEKRFYKYIPEVRDENTGDILNEASYVLTEVDEENPWTPGLEPRVVLEDGEFILGWFEQNTTTIDGVNAQISSLQVSLADLQESQEQLRELVGSPLGENDATGIFAALEIKADADSVYTKEEADAAIKTAIAASEHLSRKILNSYEEIVDFITNKGVVEASKYIFMIPDANSLAEGDIYNEYIVVDGVIEVVGKWATDLADYVSNEQLNTILDTYVKESDLNQLLNNYVSFNELNEELRNYTNKEELNNLLDNKVDKEEGYRLISFEEIDKLNSLVENSGNNNFIKSVSEDFFVSIEGKLSLNTSENSLFANFNKELNSQKDSLDSLRLQVTQNESALQELESTVEEIVLQYETVEDGIQALNATVVETKTAVETNKSLINSLNESLKNYVTTESYNADITDIYKHLTWSSIED